MHYYKISSTKTVNIYGTLFYDVSQYLRIGYSRLWLFFLLFWCLDIMNEWLLLIFRKCYVNKSVIILQLCLSIFLLVFVCRLRRAGRASARASSANDRSRSTLILSTPAWGKYNNNNNNNNNYYYYYLLIIIIISINSSKLDNIYTVIYIILQSAYKRNSIIIVIVVIIIIIIISINKLELDDFLYCYVYYIIYSVYKRIYCMYPLAFPKAYSGKVSAGYNITR